MALVIGEWCFAPGQATPDLPAVAALLQRAMNLPVQLEGVGREAVLHVPRLRECLFDLRSEVARLTLHGFAPAHPYLWEALDGVLTAAGGSVAGNSVAWRPDPQRAWLRRPWSALGARDRWLLGLPSVLATRPLDRWLTAPARPPDQSHPPGPEKF